MYNQTGFALNVTTLSIELLACLNSFIALICIIYYILYNRTKEEDKVPIMHCIHIYLLLLIYTGICVFYNIQTLLGDLYGYDFNSSLCIFFGYISPVVLTALYWSFGNQAFFRLCRIIYAHHRWVQGLKVCIIIPVIEFLVICIIFYPILYWNDVIYLPNEHYCYVPYTHFRGILWLAFNCYGIPTASVSLIYLRITIYLRTHSNTQTLVVKQRWDRDLVIIRRLLITIGLLLALGIPGVVLLTMLRITGEEYPLLLRIEWLFVSFSMLGLSLSTAIFTSQLENIFFKKSHRNRVVVRDEPMVAAIPLRCNTITK